MDYNAKKMRILEMVEKNIISADEGSLLLQKLDEEIDRQEGGLMIPDEKNAAEEKKSPPKKKDRLSRMMDDDNDDEDEEEDEEDDDDDDDDDEGEVEIDPGGGKSIRISGDGIHIVSNGKKIVAENGNLEIVTRGGKKSISIGSKGKKDPIGKAIKFASMFGTKTFFNASDKRRFVVRITSNGKVTTDISLPISMAKPFLKAGFKVAKVSGKEGESIRYMDGDDFVTYVSDNAKDMEYLKEINMKVVEEFLKNNETGTILDLYQEKDDVRIYVGVE
ncbi:MAG: hypothetical protein Q4A75_07710 [Peptostreptococcaceae bacterium]|nr:hypothetical protein [Peptostreptococcaceae bacterium]